MSDRPSAEAEGLRIAATRAGQQNGDAWDDDIDGEGWGSGASRTRTSPGRHGDGDGDGEGNGHRRGRGGRRRPKRGMPAAMPVAITPPSTSTSTASSSSASASSSAATVAAATAARSGFGPRPVTRPASSTRRKVLRQRRRRRRALIACTFLITVCTFVTAVGYVYLHSRLDQIPRLDLANLAAEPADGAMNVLLVGSDSRAALDGAEADSFGPDQVSGPRSDTIMILHVDPARQQAAIVSVPRDLFLPIAGTTYADRVNRAFAMGGADQLVATIQAALGVTINHYVQVDFDGFKDVVDTLGGVTLYVPYPARDSVSGLSLDRSGCLELDGDEALTWVRSRQAEFLVNGTWVPDTRGDLGRIERQQDLVRRVMRKAASLDVTNPVRLNRLVGVAVQDVTFDSALTTKDITTLGRRFSDLDPEKVVLRTLPTTPATAGGKSVLLLQVDQAQPLLGLLNGGVLAEEPALATEEPAAASAAAPAGAAATTTTGTAGTTGLKASDVKVRVLNGVGTPGAAAKAATSLTTLGFTVADKGDATAISAKTTISYGSGQLAKAQLLQGSLVTPAVLREDATLKAVDVNLVLGGDYTGVKSGISSGTSSVSTTVPATGATGANPFATAPSTSVATQVGPVPLPEGSNASRC